MLKFCDHILAGTVSGREANKLKLLSYCGLGQKWNTKYEHQHDDGSGKLANVSDSETEVSSFGLSVRSKVHSMTTCHQGHQSFYTLLCF